mmetsp:Transcript_3209/g.3128  ORF Transcript_3209/g.3128 Transcript_3209/m.3128 type:complete len:197 (+) Transcript_3209:878-1468(+)
MSMGYIGRSAKDLALAFKVHSHPSITGLDPSLPRMPFNEEQFERGASGKIKVGYIDSFPFLSATDATKRAVSEAKQALESQGYELVPFNFTAEEVADLTEVSLTIGCDPDFFDTLKTVGDNYEPLMPCYTLSAFITQTNVFIRFLFFAILTVMGERRFIKTIKNFRPLSKKESHFYLLRRLALIELLEKKWKDHEI